MSSAGIYNYRPKVDNPNKVFSQMESDEFQPPFYFGGSQVPVNLNQIKGSGFKTTNYKISKDQIKQVPMMGHGLGLGLKTTTNKNDNIRLAKYMFHQ
jgi:hypothetical protein